MPEYLSPDVYVEEIDTGSKPIEGVSTSTAAMLGVTERGPANVPILVTSYGEFTRWFGDRLDPDIFGAYSFLPYAVEGFFTNGGKRLFVTRVEAQGAQHATFDVGDRGSAASAHTRLLRPAGELTGLAASPVYVLNVADIVYPGSGTLAPGARIRIGAGSETEYRIAATVGDFFHVPLSLPLARAHASALIVSEIPLAMGPAPNVFALASPSARGASQVVLNTPPANVAVDDLLEIDAASDLAEFRFVLGVAADSAGCLVTLDSPLGVEHLTGMVVNKRDPAPGDVDSAPLNTAAVAGGDVAFVTPGVMPMVNFHDRTHLVVVDRVNDHTMTSQREARRIGLVGALPIGGAFANYPAGSVIAGATLTAAPPAKHVTAAAVAGSVAVTVDDRTVLNAGDIVLIGTAPVQEYATVAAIPASSPIAPNAGVIVLTHPLQNVYGVGADVLPMAAPVLRTDRPATGLLLDATTGDVILAVGDGGDGADLYTAGDIVRVTTPTGETFFHALTAGTIACDPHPIVLAIALERPHPIGSDVAERGALLDVQAIDSGAWGNRLRVTIEDEAPGLVSRTPVMVTIAANRVRIGSLSGIEAGTILEIVDAATSAQLGDAVKVQQVDRATGEIILDPSAPLSPAQFATLLGAPPAAYQLRSREFRLTVRLMRQPDPMVPSRNGQVLDLEVFRFLSMDPRHSRYVQTIIGDIFGPPRLSDRRPDGESWYIRVSDDAPSNDVRFGPEPLTDRLADGRVVPAQNPLVDGDDSLITLNDAAYIGADDVNPENRTGLFSLGNVDEVSIVACPGRTSGTLQGALIAHCENYRYRVAILDGPPPPNDAIDDVRNQRQQFDSKYAALYHPWLLIDQPFPTNAAAPPEFAIPPSGHVIGVIARTDIERGVHKAPANEVVRGVLGLQRVLNRDQQDLLNPSPTNINVIRDFRTESRGIRVYGARCITYDTDWKYLNVRRLMIFIEKSINVSLQWVVFEPNAEPLWARVRRSIANFLTLVWRNGALEGTKPEEAFFVKCDRTTMTQTDIDEGRLICYVGVAPVKPAEFVIVRIGLWTANANQ
jgi:Bacteriophage tail sheath protein